MKGVYKALHREIEIIVTFFHFLINNYIRQNGQNILVKSMCYKKNLLSIRGFIGNC